MLRCRSRASDLARLALALGVAASLATQAPTPSSIGLKNRWYTEGGSASRSGAVATEPLAEAPEPAWRFAAPGTIVGEPLVWDDAVVFECELPKGRRRLQVLELADGQPLVHKDFFPRDSKLPLAPALWNRDVIVRTGGKLKRHRFGEKGISEQRASKKVPRLGAPLRVGDAVFVIADGRLERWSATSLKRQWQSRDGGFRGAVAVAGDGVLGVRAATEQGGELVRLRRANGSQLGRIEIPTPAIGQDPRLAAGDFAVFLHGLGAIKLVDGSSVNSLRYDLPLPRGDAAPVLATMATAPVIGTRRWIAACGSNAEPMLGIGRQKSDEFTVLATSKAHDYLLSAPITLAGHVAYFGGVAVDVETLEVRWRIDAPAGARAIPARDALLYRAGNEIVAFRRPGADAAAATLARYRQWSAAYEEVRHRELQQLVGDALDAREMELVDELLRRCRAAGVDEKWVADQARLRKARSRVRADSEPAALAQMRRRAAELDELALTSLWRRLEAEGLDADDHLRALRFVHELDPAYPRLADAVRALVPEKLRPAGAFDVTEWLGFVEGTRSIPIDFLPVPAEAEIGTASPDQLELLKLRASWRKDLVAVQSPRLLVYTPVSAPGGLAQCLSLGELVCDTLEAMFADYPVVRRDPRRMRILLFPTKAGYEKHSPGGGHLAWTAGHYSPQEQLSRMYLPKDKEAFARVMPVFVHELTHQWLQDRCPAIDAGRAARRRHDQPAYWIVEGFASFVEEFAFDLERRTHATDSPRDENLDILGHATPRQLLSWGAVLRISPLGFHRISPVPSRSVKLGYRLGVERALSPRNFFYAQAGALCHWLWHADDGARRKALLDFVLAHYHGDVDRLDLGKEIGMSADAIGAAVVEYAAARRP